MKKNDQVPPVGPVESYGFGDFKKSRDVLPLDQFSKFDCFSLKNREKWVSLEAL